MEEPGQPKEWRDVRIETERGPCVCYMTNSPELSTKEREKRGFFLSDSSLSFLRIDFSSNNPVRDKMKELGAVLSISTWPSEGPDKGTYNALRENGDFVSVPLKLLIDWNKYTIISKRDADLLIDNLLGNLRTNQMSDARVQNLRQILYDGIEKRDERIMHIVFNLRTNSIYKARLMQQETYLINMLKFIQSFLTKKVRGNSMPQEERHDMEVMESFSFKAEKRFSELLESFRIEEKMTNADLYRKAYMSRQEYYKIKSGKSVPSRETIAKLAFALKLGIERTDTFMASAGISLRHDDRFSRLLKKMLGQNKNLGEAMEEFYKAGLSLERGHNE